MLDSLVHNKALPPIDVSRATQIGAQAQFAPIAQRPATIPDEIPVSIHLCGTTFLGVYGIVGDTIELMSPDFGETATARGTDTAQTVAERLLRTLAAHAIQTTQTPFMPDHRSGAGF